MPLSKEERLKQLKEYPNRKTYTSVSLEPEEYELLRRVAKRLGTSQSKVMGLAVRRYAVEMGITAES